MHHGVAWCGAPWWSVVWCGAVGGVGCGSLVLCGFNVVEVDNGLN